MAQPHTFEPAYTGDGPDTRKKALPCKGAIVACRIRLVALPAASQVEPVRTDF